jgi:hypothetical protein
VNLTRLLGVVTLATGGSLLVSEPLLGHDLLTDLIGTSLTTLRAVCGLAVVLGALAVRLGRRDEQEFQQHKEGQDL